MSRRAAAASRRRAAAVDPSLLTFVAANTGAGTTSGTTLVFTTTADIAVDSLLVIASGHGTITGDTASVTSISVSAGAVTGMAESASAVRASTTDLHLHAARVTTLIPAGSTVTVTFAASSGKRYGVLAVWDQVTGWTAETSSGVFSGGDGGTSAGPNGNSTTPLATATAGNTSSAVLVVGASTMTGGHTSTPGTGFTEVAESQTTVGSGDKGLQLEFKIVRTAGTQSAGNTLSTGNVWAAVVATFPIAA